MESITNERYNYCKGCGRVLSSSYTKEYCSTCEELRLFDSVREYIRGNDVNEYDVAEHFDIPVAMVKQWIREGRIQYKENGKRAMGSMYCSRCGAKISFGSLCPKCLKLLNGENGVRGFAQKQVKEDGKMRFIDSEEES